MLSRYNLIIMMLPVMTCAESGVAASLYGITFTSTQGSVLYDVSVATRETTHPRPTGLDHVVGISFGPADTLYALTNTTAPTLPNSLVRIELATGASEAIGPTGLSDIVEGDLAYDRTTGVMYGMYEFSGLERRLFTLDLLTGAGTTLPIAVGGDPSAMTFGRDGTLYLIDTTQSRLITIDKTTGATLTARGLSRPLGSVAGMAFDPFSGSFYVADGDSNGSFSLYRLNAATGQLTPLGPAAYPNGLAGLAFLPEPASLLLILLGAGGVHSSRRRNIRDPDM